MEFYKRKAVFGFLTLIFFIVGPLLIAYAAGYTFDLGRGSFIKTGGIFIKSSTRVFHYFSTTNLKKKLHSFLVAPFLPILCPGIIFFVLKNPTMPDGQKN